jgi:hypothetical protein
MFIVCGEALFDVFATGSTPTGLGFDGRIGGSPFNVAWAWRGWGSRWASSAASAPALRATG